MRAPLSWLRELVEIQPAVPDLARRLTMAGLEVEEIHAVGADWREVTLARITDLEPHPRNPNLQVARLDLGGRSATVVTAAANLVVGAIVPYVAAGGRLPAGQVGTRTFSSITSEGMVCSGDELDISPDKEGIYLFEPEAPIGQPVAEYLNEIVLDIAITPNRADCMSMVGLAREVHALTGGAYTPAFERALQARLEGSQAILRDRLGALEPASGTEPLSIRIDDSVGCPRFSATLVRDIRIGPSPHWLQRRLHFAGVRPISNVVDVTNYVMLELGQPLHAFDRQRLNSDTLVVRRAHEGERLRTLDGEERVLSSTMMVVADTQRARSLAGIMGGEDSEIAETTREVVLEGANWDRASIRLTSAAFNLPSEASRRFARGVDPDLTAVGVARATQLMLELAGGSLVGGLVDNYPGRQPTPTIHVRPRQIDALLGVHYPPEQVVQTLDALGFGIEDHGDDLTVTVPGWRRFDVEGRADLAEEVARVLGYELVPATMLRGALPEPRPEGDAGFSDELRARRTLAAAGLQEVITYSWVDPSLAAELVADQSEVVADRQVPIANPQSVDQSVLRTSLLGSLLLVLRSNLRQTDRVLLFELARTWQDRPPPEDPNEQRHLGIAVAGPRSPRHWSGLNADPLDFFDLTGIVDALCGAFRVRPTYVAARHPSLHPGRTAEVCVGETRLGVLGELHPAVVKRFDLATDGPRVLLAELNFDRLLEARAPLVNVQTPSRFPAADRDIAIIVDESVRHAEVEQVIRDAAGPLLERVELFDIYRGESIPAGRKSLAYALRYRAPDRTLEDDEVAATHGRVEEAVRTRVGAEVRGR